MMTMMTPTKTLSMMMTMSPTKYKIHTVLVLTISDYFHIIITEWFEITYILPTDPNFDCYLDI